ncbi:MAG: hypothetical protein KGI50_05490 [Patescibacteria group bacterium]|nr:hypothetical protein [Patescibacteria group bacterium]MDE2438741.1 hypothetical protein [Patescibacteria group bacterium]
MPLLFLFGCYHEQQPGEIYQLSEACIKGKSGVIIKFIPQHESSQEMELQK